MTATGDTPPDPFASWNLPFEQVPLTERDISAVVCRA